MAEQLVRCGIRQHCRSVLPQLLDAGFTDGRIGLLFEDLIRQFQLCHINECIRITGKHAAAGGTIHAPLAALCPLAVVVAVDHRTAQLGAHLVELVAEMCHLVGTVLVAGDDLVNGVDDDGNEVLLFRPTNQFRCKFVHRFGYATQMPHFNIPNIDRRYLQSSINIMDSVVTGSLVQF